MKQIIFFAILLMHLQSFSQADTITTYYENGQLKCISPRLDGKAHGLSRMWYESGKLWSESVSINGKQIKTMMYHENGNRSYFVRYRKWKVKLKLWHPNGQIWSKSTSKYSKSIEREFDSTGVLQRKTIEKKGSSLACSVPDESNPSDSAMYRDGSCVCSWGEVYWRNGVWIDEKGRDLSTNYSYMQLVYYQNGSIQKETIWNKELKKYFVREYDEDGNMINESEL